MYFAPKHMEIIAAGMATWSYEKTCELIELYEAHPCLYNIKHKEYHDRNLRGKALEEISTALEIPGTFYYVT